MTFPFKLSEKIIPVLIILQVILLVGSILSILAYKSREDAIKDAILCDFYVQAREWRSGYAEYVSPEFITQNEQGALRTYRRVIADEAGLCEEGMCLDSAQITLFKSCPDEGDVQILKDTLIYY